MRLITHNMLQCNVKTCTANNFPLRFEQVELVQSETEFQPDFLRNMIDRIDWDALVATAHQLGLASLPAQIPDNLAEDEETLRHLHTLLLETQVQTGLLVCNGCSHVYPIKDGIVNMLLAEHEL